MTPEQRSARASKAGQVSAENRRARLAAQAQRIADAEALEAKRARQGRLLPTHSERISVGEAFPPQEVVTDTLEPPVGDFYSRAGNALSAGRQTARAVTDRALAEHVLATIDRAEGDFEAILDVMASAMLDPPFRASPAGNMVRKGILRRVLAVAENRGWRLRRDVDGG